MPMTPTTDKGKNIASGFGWEDPEEFKNTILGMGYDEWVNKLGIGEDEVNKMFGRLGQRLGTQQSQAMNLISDQGYDLPEATRLAQQRGVAQGGAEAYTKGTENIERMASGANRQAWSQIMGADMNEEQFKEEMKFRREQLQAQIDAQDSAWWEDFLEVVGGAAGTYAGAYAYNNL